MDEKNFKDIIKQAQQVLYCPTCGRQYQLEEIRLRGLLDDTLILQTICSNHHAPVLTLYMTNSVEGLKSQQGQSVIESSKGQQAPSTKRMTKDDVLTLHEGLEKFDGNFRGLWNMS